MWRWEWPDAKRRITFKFICRLAQDLVESGQEPKDSWLKEKFLVFVLLFCTSSLIIRIFTFVFDVLQHYYDEPCSPEMELIADITAS